MYLVNAAQMKHAEDTANTEGLSYDAMMENAGRAVAQAIDAQFDAYGKQITILIGPGNNGGDGLVAARYLSELGATVSLYIWKRHNLNTDPNWQRLEDYSLSAVHHQDDSNNKALLHLINRSAIIIDALLGTGVSRPIQGDLANLLNTARTAIDERRQSDPRILINPLEPIPTAEIGPVIVAVDIPSGLYTDSGQLDPHTLPADLTITFAAPKRGQVSLPGGVYVGQLLIADIDILPEHFPPDLPQLATFELIADLLPERPIYGHKGTFGKALIISGSANYTGAPYLSASAAYRVGAGLVTLALPSPVQAIVAPKLTEATYIPLAHKAGAIGGNVETLKDPLTRYSALLIGPGLGQAEVTQDFFNKLLPHLSNIPCVLDADALNILAKQPEWWTHLPPNTILTPHPGEMSRLSQIPIAQMEGNRLDLVPQLAKKWKQIIVYKGAFTIIASPQGEVVVMPFANPALATAGSGDVLAGCIVGLLAQKLPPFMAAVSGVYLHGLAGEMARNQLWEAGVMASDLLPLLPLAIKEIVRG